jgi:hypothetical protein
VDQPHFCKFSSLWFPATASFHEGAYGADQWRRLFRKGKTNFFDFLLWGLLIAQPIALGIHWGWSQPEPWFHTTWIGLSLLFLTCTISLHIYSGWKSRNDFFSRIFQLDLWMGFFFAALAIETSIESPLSIAVVALASFGWFQLRAFESFLWRKQLKNSFRDEALIWTPEGTPHAKILRLEKMLALIGLLCVGSAAALHIIPLRASFLIGCFLPALLSWPQWCSTFLLAKAERLHVVCQEFQKFSSLRFSDLLLFHQTGVLTSRKFKFRELWIDKKEDFTEAEIRDVFRQLAELSEHPIAEALLKELPEKSRELMKLNKSEVLPNLGLSAEFEDSKRHKATAVLSGLTWQKILQHEVSEEGMDKIREWKREKMWTSFLSLNRKVVAAVVWENAAVAPDANFKFDRPMVVFSSQPHFASGISENLFEQVCVNLLPLERRTQMLYWQERAKKILEVKSIWDSKASDNSFEMTMVSARQDLKDRALGIINGDLTSVCASVKAATKFNKDVQLISMFMVVGTIVSFWTGALPVVAAVLYVVSLAWIARPQEVR